VILLLLIVPVSNAQDGSTNTELDSRVRAFLKANEGQWHDMNVPASDGRMLYDLVIKGNYKKALEIGTSTGYSGIYIAWALSKTGGKLTTIEIDPRRHRMAKQHFAEAGLTDYVDARLADAHELVKELEGPFDFVFSDADKHWYRKYFDELDPKLKVGGCYASHNISDGRGGFWGGTWSREYHEYVSSLDHFETELVPGSSMMISYKTAGR